MLYIEVDGVTIFWSCFLDDSLLVNGQMLEVEADDYVPKKPIRHGKQLSKKRVQDNAEDPARNGKKSIQT